MNLIAKNIMDIQLMIKDLKEGNISAEKFSTVLAGIRETRKYCNLVIQAYAVSSKNKRAMAGLEKMNLIDDTTAIDLMLGDPEVDKAKCPLKDNLITRAECLDYSGTHYDDCVGCEIGKATKDKLIPIR